MSDVNTVGLPLLPLPGGVVVPTMVVQLGLESAEARAAVDAAVRGDRRVVLVPKLENRYAAVGTVASIEQVNRTPDGGRLILVRGVGRARIGAGHVEPEGALTVQAEIVEETTTVSTRANELAREYRAVLSEILEYRNARGILEAIKDITHPGALADTAVYSPDLSVDRKVEVLETLDVEARLAKVTEWTRETLADLELRDKVRKDASERIDKSQREYLLRQQLASIRAELGEGGEDGEDLVESYRARIAEADLPDDARKAADREVGKLERMGEQNPEHGWIRTWLDTLLELPWGKRSADRLDLGEAKTILDADHEGLGDVKERILEFLAVRKLRTERGLAAEGGRGSGAILALVGPPGVGKTSLGESVAHTLDRSFVRVALGGVRDEAEIRGHRRTYVGAQPGRIVRALKEAGSMNPVFLLDEVDKVGSDWRGDPSSALLEVLDPAQNHTFRDHYLEVDLDLSDVVFIATANVLETIPGPLLDRMEIIRLDGYTDDEKAAIARTHLLPRQIERAGLRPDELEVSDEALERIVEGWTREAGVRGLERQLGKLTRKLATRVAASSDGTESRAAYRVGPDDVRDLLGRPPIQPEPKARTAVPGVATGLAVTGAGGDVLFIEASVSDGEPGLTLTGQLGDVMKESASIALSYVRSHAEQLGLPSNVLEGKRVHVHVPAGAVPKDGPSAGVTMTTALASLLSGRAVRDVVGMTGEVTLQGRVLPIGGVKQKVLAAHRAGLREVILPARNGDDVEDVPEAVRAEMTFHLADEVGQVLDHALEPQTVAA